MLQNHCKGMFFSPNNQKKTHKKLHPCYIFTTVPLKWTNRSLKSLKLSHLRVVLGVHGFEFVPLQPN